MAAASSARAGDDGGKVNRGESSPPLGEIREREQATEKSFFRSLLALKRPGF